MFERVDLSLTTTSGPKVRRADIHEGGYPWFHRPHRRKVSHFLLLGTVDERTKAGPSPMHRQQMVAILERNLPASCTVHSKKRLISYMEVEQDPHLTSSIRLEFADGTTKTTDVLIGADGIRSAVRKTMFEVASADDDKTDLKQYADATFTGITVYRCLISAEPLRKENPEHPSLKDMTIVSSQFHSV